MTINFSLRTEAQRAARAAAVASLKFGRRKKEQPEPFGRAPSQAPMSPHVKTVPQDMRALIDAFRHRSG